jgi:glycosyltransferase involved in cell wall biosynthesis
VSASADRQDGTVRISVVVPTRDRVEHLGRCLHALAMQDAEGLEVVVVDDGSRDRGAVMSATARVPGARVMRTSGAGPAAARNLGARAATGEVICFTDDDCEPEPAWARLLGERARLAGAAAGRTVSPQGAVATVVASQAITNHLQLASLSPGGDRLGFSPTCNLACSRQAIAALPFDESFPDAAGEDRDWSARAVAAGMAPAFVPRAVVVHRQRLTPAGFLRQQVRYGRGASRFRRRASERRLARPAFYVALARAGFREGARVGALVLAAQGATAAGILAERLGVGQN